MLAVNILFKGACLLIIWRLLKKNTHETRALYVLILIAFSPIYFLYSRLLMAENLACPLLIISVLYHEHYRNAAIKLGGGKTAGLYHSRRGHVSGIVLDKVFDARYTSGFLPILEYGCFE